MCKRISEDRRHRQTLRAPERRVRPRRLWDVTAGLQRLCRASIASALDCRHHQDRAGAHKFLLTARVFRAIMQSGWPW
jgi:hypothetical protein